MLICNEKNIKCMKTLCPHCEKEIEITLTYTKKIDEHDNVSAFIEQVVAGYFNLSLEKLKTKCRQRKYVYPRQLIYYFKRINTKDTWKGMAEVFKADHTTAIHSYHTIKDFINIDEKVRVDVDKINFLLH